MKDSLELAGFTIVELLVVVVVIAILSSVTVVAYNGVSGRARTDRSLSTLHEVQQKAAIWSQFTGSYPDLAQFRTNSLSPTDIDTAEGEAGPVEAKLSSPAVVMGASMNEVRADGGNTVYYAPCGSFPNFPGAHVQYWNYELGEHVDVVVGTCP